MRIHYIILSLAPTLFSLQAHCLKIACSQQWIEHTPLAYAASNFYNKAGGDQATIISGGIPNLADKSVDLAGNAETQGLKNYVTHKNYRLIGIIVEVTYRLVAANNNKASPVTQLSDLRGKRIGTIAGTSAEVFVRQLLASTGLSNPTTDYTTVNGQVCMREPCAANTFPALLRDGKIDAFGVWETSVELGIRALGGPDNVAVFKNASLYREVYSLYSTQEKLADAAMRRRIVQFVRALNRTYDLFRNATTSSGGAGEDVYTTVARTVGVDVPVLKSVWPDHIWGPGKLDGGLLDYLEREDQYLARVDRRQPFSRAELERFVDTSVYEEAMQG
jgi:ABC-type nitrate/sulfonate/bicarbonate transport system substrate-binding protein